MSTDNDKARPVGAAVKAAVAKERAAGECAAAAVESAAGARARGNGEAESGVDDAPASATLIDFPARIDVKAMGIDEDEFRQCVEGLVVPHLDGADYRVSTQSSKGGKYLSVRVHILAHSLDQLHAIYADLKAEPRVLYIL